MSAFDSWITHKDYCAKCWTEVPHKGPIILHLCRAGQLLYMKWMQTK